LNTPFGRSSDKNIVSAAAHEPFHVSSDHVGLARFAVVGDAIGIGDHVIGARGVRDGVLVRGADSQADAGNRGSTAERIGAGAKKRGAHRQGLF
jgi:hypothetical protein